MSDHNSNSVAHGQFRWFVLLVFVVYSMSESMTFMLFAPIPKQTASYYGVTGQKFESYNTLYNN